MKIITGDIWTYIGQCDAICITTNGIVKKNGELVMGAGIAKECKLRYPRIPKLLGQFVKLNGNSVYPCYKDNDTFILSFPTKNDYRENSKISLIKKSCEQVVKVADKMNWKKVIIPKPGCNNGRLNWKEVRKHIEPLLDDRFYIISKSETEKDERKILECSSKGDKRFSALYAKVSVNGKIDTIENHYQLSKRINSFVPKDIKSIKGKDVTHFEIDNVKYPKEYLTSFYELLWIKYLDNHKDLVSYARGFDCFNDMFAGKHTINSQATVIRDYVQKGRQYLIDKNKKFINLMLNQRREK